MSRHPTAKRKFPGIKPRVTGGILKWRACVKRDGRQHVGEYRDTQEEAHDDYRKMSRTRSAGAEMTLGDALDLARADMVKRGLDAGLIGSTHDVVARRIGTFFNRDTLLSSITRDDIEWLVKLSLATKDEDGRPKRALHANTVRAKDCQLLSRCFRLATLPDPVKAARNIPRKVRTEMACFTIEEASELIRRMRNEVFLDANGNPINIRSRTHDADTVEFLLLSGVRAHEFARIRITDVDLRLRTIRIRPKIKSLPRSVFIPDELLPTVNRLVGHARAQGWQRLAGGDGTTINSLIGNLQRRWKRRLGEPRLNGRTLRHSSITGVLDSGGSVTEAMNHGGHGNVSTTDRYVHARQDREGRTITRLARALKASRGGPKAEAS